MMKNTPPTSHICPYCLNDKDTRKRPSQGRVSLIDAAPCSVCKEHMENGFLLVSVSDTTLPPKYTGGWAAVTLETMRKVFKLAEDDAMMQQRYAYVTDEVWDNLGRPPRVEPTFQYN